MTRRVLSAIVLSLILFVSAYAFANSDELLTFQGLGDGQTVGNFYNGSGLPTTPNYGVSFSSNFYGLISFENGGSGNFAPFTNGVINPPIVPAVFMSGTLGSTVTGTMNVAPGFGGGINFYFTAGFATGQTETVSVWSGPNGTGTVLATIVLGNNNTACTSPAYCNWTDVQLSLANGQKGYSVTFTGPANELGITEITLGSNSTAAIPEPSPIYLLGTGVVAIGIGKMRKLFRV